VFKQKFLDVELLKVLYLHRVVALLYDSDLLWRHGFLLSFLGRRLGSMRVKPRDARRWCLFLKQEA